MQSIAHTNFEAAFTQGTVFVKDGNERQVDVVEEGTFCPASGQILVSDPTTLDPQLCLQRKVTPGVYPVYLSCWENYIACVKVQFSQMETVQWEIAERLCDEGKAWRPGMIPGFGADSGMGALVDGEVARQLMNDNTWFDRFSQEFDKREGATCQLVLDDRTQASLVACYAGYGDGCYPCYWGLDQKSEPTCLIVDFLMFVEGVHSVHELTDLISKIGCPLTNSWFEEHGFEQVRLSFRSKTHLVLHFESDDGWDDISLILVDGISPVCTRSKGGKTGRECEVEWRASEKELKDARIQFKKFVGFQSLPCK